jgi:hypothetical protein
MKGAVSVVLRWPMPARWAGLAALVAAAWLLRLWRRTRWVWLRAPVYLRPPALIVVVCMVLLAGCATTAPMVEVRVPVPVECRVNVPARPAMPTDGLGPGAALDAAVAAMLAELELREGYEKELRAALATCTAPIPP